jgi:hypothetical protein
MRRWLASLNYDALTPNDQNLEDAWDKLLSSVGLDVISKEPLFQGARAFNTSSYSN